MALKLKSAPKYRKKIGAFGALDVKHSESVLDFSSAKECYNFDFSSGALRDGYGVETKDFIPAGAKRFWTYRYYNADAGAYVDQYLYQIKSGLVRYYDSYTQKHTYVANVRYSPLSVLPYRLNSEDVLLVSCEGHRLITWNGKYMLECSSTPRISSMALHYERLFVTSSEEPTKVFFSDDLDPTNWDMSSGAGGFIELLDERGALNKVVSFGNYLYIFREHGISRVTAFGDQNEFSVTNLFVTAGRIVPDSIALCGGVIIFLASDGLYSFDGYECARILKNLDGAISSASAGAYFDGKYYLACKMKFGDGETVGCESGEYTSNALLVLSVGTGEYTISRGLDISFLGGCNYLGDEFLATCEGGVGCAVSACGSRRGEPLKKRWHGAVSDFGAPDRIKTAREAFVRSATGFTLFVSTEKKQKAIPVKAGDRRVRLNASGRRLGLSIGAENSNVDIAPPALIYTTR